MIEKHVKDLLIQKGSVAIVGLGIFSLEYKKPKIDKAGKKISPPSKDVQFKWNPRERDSGLLAFVSKERKLKLSEAQAFIKKEVADLLKTLDKSQKVEWKDLGVFSGDHNNVLFKSSGKNLHTGAGGAKEVKSGGAEAKIDKVKPKSTPKAKPAAEKTSPKPKEEPKSPEVKDEKAPVKPVVIPSKEEKPKEVASAPEKPVEEKPKIEKPAEEKPKVEKPVLVGSSEEKQTEKPEKEKEKKGSMAWLWILLIVVLAGSAITLYIINREPEPPPVVEEPVQQEEPEEPEPVVEEEPPPPPPKILTISERTGRFYIILGGFSSKDNAMNLRDEIEQKGAGDAKVVLPYPPKNLYRVSIEDHDSQEAAIDAMRKLRADYGNYIWVLTY